jgi:ABC-type Zn uptake system ZnuABC Zn-binding protein ZnuA
MKMAIVAADEADEHGIEESEAAAEKCFARSVQEVKEGGVLFPKDIAYQVIFDPAKDVSYFHLKIPAKGAYVVFTEHMPSEFEAGEHFLKDANGVDVEPKAEEPSHGHEQRGDVHEKSEEHAHGHHGQGHHHHGGKDPHIWLDPVNAQTMVDNIAEAFAAKDPANSAFYRNNAKEYNAKLADLDRRFRETLSTAKHKTIIYGGHFAFGYFAERYGLEHVSPYDGFSPNAEPNPKAIAELIDRMKASGMKYIYYEELIDPKVARVISQETGAELELLHGAHNVSKDELDKGVTYIDIMEDNLAKLKVGLECR